jgi:outer membrane protein assembly factor BamB
VRTARSGPGYLVALDAATGARRWRSADLGGPIYQPVVVGGIVCCTVVGLSKSTTFGLDGRTGREIWHSPVPGAALVGTGNIVFLVGFAFSATSSSFTIWARHAGTGALAWTRKFPGGPAFAVAGDVLYLGYGPSTGTVQAIAAATGHVLWTHRAKASPASLAVGNSTVYALDQDSVYALQAYPADRNFCPGKMLVRMPDILPGHS